MKLKSHLRETTLEHLLAIARCWEIPVDPVVGGDPGALAEYLYPRLQTLQQFRTAFDKLQTADRDWIYFLALHGGELPVDEFRRRMRLSEDEPFQERFRRLNEVGMVWLEPVRDPIIRTELIGIPDPFVRMLDLPAYWQGFLGYYLQSLGTQELLTVARNALDERPASRKKQALVHYLRRRLLDPKILRPALERRDPLQRDMFNQILQKNGVCAWKELLDTSVHKKFDHQRAERLRDLVEESGLVFVLQAAPNKYNNLLIVPRDIAWLLHNGATRDDRSLEELSRGGPDPVRPGEATGRPKVILDNSNNILRDLVILCSFILRNPVKILNSGGIGRNDFKKIVPLLSFNKTVKYAAFLAKFAATRKLIIPVGETWGVSSFLAQWLERGRGCYRDLYDFWMNTLDWNEELLEGDINHLDTPPANLVNIPELRKLVLRMLEKVPQDAWIDFETFAESMLPQVAIEIPGRFDMIPSDRFNRHMVLIIESVVAESLYWLGVVLLGVADTEVARQLGSRPNESIAPFDPTHPISMRLIGSRDFIFSFKLTEFGRWMFARPYQDPEKLFKENGGQPAGEFTIQPNLEIIAPPDLPLGKFYRLLQFANIKKMDIMATLAITRDSLREGMDHGLSAEQMLRFLGESSRKEIPETVRQMITECDSRHGEVQMGFAGGYIMVNERIRVEELKANGKIAPSIKDVYGDLILLSRTADFKKVARELQRLGYLPQIDSDSLHVTTDGLFQITLRPEELYDLLALISFAIQLEQEAGVEIFEDRVRPLLQRLTAPARERFNPAFYSESITKSFASNYDKAVKKRIEEETRKYRKQIARLMSQVPSRRSGPEYKGENPASSPAEIQKLVKFAMEHELAVKIRYQRASGEEISETIEPESLQGKKLYAFCPDRDGHHIFSFERITRASI